MLRVRLRSGILPNQLGPGCRRRAGVRHSDGHHGWRVLGPYCADDRLGQKAQGSAGTSEVHHQLSAWRAYVSRLSRSQKASRLESSVEQGIYFAFCAFCSFGFLSSRLTWAAIAGAGAGAGAGLACCFSSISFSCTPTGCNLTRVCSASASMSGMDLSGLQASQSSLSWTPW